MKNRTAFLLAFLLLYACSVLHADIGDFNIDSIETESTQLSDDHRWVIAGTGGASFPIDVKFDGFSLNPSATVGGELAYRLTSWVTAGLEAQYSLSYGLRNQPDLGIPGIEFDFRTKLLQVTPVIEIGPELHAYNRTWKPYVALGAGLYQTTFSGTLIFDNFIVAHSEDVTSSYSGVNIGGGLMASLSQNTAAGIDCRYHRVFAPSGDWSGNPQFITPTLRVYYFF